MGFSICPERGHEGHTREVPQEDRCSSMYMDYYAWSSCTYLHALTIMIRLFYYLVFDYLSLAFLHVGNLIRNNN